MIKLAAFLGNPGPNYAGNRHNAGRLLVESLPFYSELSWQKKFKGLYAAVNRTQFLKTCDAPLADEMPEKIHFLMPETYMNCSGEPVHQAAVFFKIKPEEILVIHDELEIPLGFLSLKFSGGLGGHNGLRSMKACFSTADFWRLRLGIGRPSHDDISGWVLSDFSYAEIDTLRPALEAGSDLLIRVLSGNPENLLPEWAKKAVKGD